MAVPGTAGADRGGAVRQVRLVSAGAGLRSEGRPDRGRFDCRGNATARRRMRIKAGEVPEGWAEGSSNRLAQKDLDARWTKKGGVSYYGSTDPGTMLRGDRSVGARQPDDRRDPGPDRHGCTDKAYRSAGISTQEADESCNTKAKVRARVVFGARHARFCAASARAHIGLRNLAYNMRRLTHLENVGLSPADELLAKPQGRNVPPTAAKPRTRRPFQFQALGNTATQQSRVQSTLLEIALMPPMRSRPPPSLEGVTATSCTRSG